MIKLPSCTTGIHYIDGNVEWTVMCKNSKGTEKLREGSVPVPAGYFEREDAPLFPAELLSDVRNSFKGIVTISLPSSRLLMRVAELPSLDPGELHDMVALQIDQISPFPADQLTVSYEVLHQTEENSRVLIVAAQRKWVDQLGDLFKQQHIYIRSLDAQILTWWSLLLQHDKIPDTGRVAVLLEEHSEFSMILVDDGIPICFRSLELFHNFSEKSVPLEITEEIRYAELSLETEYGQREIEEILFWSHSDIPNAVTTALREKICPKVRLDRLDCIPSLVEGLALRSIDRSVHHVELVPREWVDLQHRKRLLKAVTFSSVAVMSLWLVVVLIASIVFSIRQAGFNRIEKEAATYAGPALAAQASREEMLSLERYANRSHSALEVLREVTVALPADVEITSFNYKKDKAVSLRGSSKRSDAVYDYFQKLGASALFSGVKDQPVSTRTVKGERVSTFAITAELPSTNGEIEP